MLREHMIGLPQSRAVTGKRKAIERHLSDLGKSTSNLSLRGFTAREGVLSGDEGVPSKSIFEIDLQLVCDSRCGSSHALNVELCVQNREAIGTNILKLDVIARTASHQSHVGVLVCPNRKYFKESNMDSSYGDDDEYLVSYQLAYHNVLTSPVMVLTIGD
jgi:hypothetical protein